MSRRKELELEDHEHELLVKKREFYEQRLQLGHHEAAETCLQGLAERIAAVGTEAQTEWEAC